MATLRAMIIGMSQVRASIVFLYLCMGMGMSGTVTAHEPVTRARTPVNIPDVPDFLTLKGDFHIHTVFSDGLVWPTVRSEEAWREGLDVIAITDHIEYLPHKADVSTNHNRAYEIARDEGRNLDLLVIRGSEITRDMPPGHLNAIFLKDSTALAVNQWPDAVKAARDQGAFIFWNHPGWDAQLKDGRVVWYPEHTALLEQGQLHGIEVVNGRDYYPEAHRWAIEKRLTMLSNSDIHSPLNLDYHVHDGDFRPITLVFATARTADAVKEALFARRTAVYSNDRLIGDAAFLKPIFERSVHFSRTNRIELKGRQSVTLQIHNASDVNYRLEQVRASSAVSAPAKLTLAAGKTILFGVQGRLEAGAKAQKPALVYRVANLLVGPDQPLEVTLPLDLSVTSNEIKPQ